MEVPKSFQLQNHTIKVEIDNLKCDKNEALGLAEYNENKIYLANESYGEKLGKTVIFHSFAHELTHFLLNAMGETEKNADEKYVDMFGGLLAQALSTMKFKK